MKAELQAAMKDAMRAKQKNRLEAIRTLLAAIQYEEMEKKVDALPPDSILGLLQRELKKRKEELEFAEKASRDDLKGKLAEEISVIEGFLPKQLSAADLENALMQMRAETPGLNMGAAMKVLKEKFPGQYDGKLASEIAKKLFATS